MLYVESQLGTQIFRDKLNRIVGTIEKYANGKWVAKDADKQVVGFYDPTTNLTKDRMHSIIGTGNQLVALLQRDTE